MTTTTDMRIDGDMTIYVAESLKDQLLGHVDGSDAQGFDLGAVEEIDSAGVQLLLLAAREAAAGGKSLRVTAASEAVRELLSLYNLTSTLEVSD